MNLAIRVIEGRIELGDTFQDDKNKDLKADFVPANPPFNVSDWGGDELREAKDPRWKYGVPLIREVSGLVGTALVLASPAMRDWTDTTLCPGDVESKEPALTIKETSSRCRRDGKPRRAHARPRPRDSRTRARGTALRAR